MTRHLTRLAAKWAAWCMTAWVMQTTCRAAGEADATAMTDSLIRRAAAAEQAGRTNDAVNAYESLLRLDTAFEPAVGPRLLDLYIGTGQVKEALARAKLLARRHPEPHAFMAGVYSRLEMEKEAELLLKKAVAEERNPHKRVTLQWQLAEAQARQGDSGAALDTLADARDRAPAAALRQASERRLDAVRALAAQPKHQRPEPRRPPTAEEAP